MTRVGDRFKKVFVPGGPAAVLRRASAGASCTPGPFLPFRLHASQDRDLMHPAVAQIVLIEEGRLSPRNYPVERSPGGVLNLEVPLWTRFTKHRPADAEQVQA